MPKFITVTQTAERIGCTRQNVLWLIEMGKFPGARKISEEANAPYLIPETEVLTYLKTRTKPLRAKAE